LATVIKILPLSWLGHVCSIEEQRDPKKALEVKRGERRKGGKHIQDGLIMLKII
jgi:hypothetical protein